MRKLSAVAAGCVFVAHAAFADALVEQKMQFKMGGALGGIVNAFGGKATHEGITSVSRVKGNRKATITGKSMEIVDLDAEKVYNVNLDRNTYKVTTFAELRKQFEEAQKEAAGEQKKEKSEETSKPEGPEYEVKFDVRETGQKQTINGYDTHEVVATVTVVEKGKTIEKAGGGVFTADMWIGPKMKEMAEIAEFDQRYFMKLYGPLYAASGMQQLAILVATNPALGKAMKTFYDKRASFDGTPVRTVLFYESVVGTEQKQQASADSGTPMSAGAAIGGLLRKAQQKRQGDAPKRNKLFETTTEVVRAAAAVAAADVDLPAGAKLQK